MTSKRNIKKRVNYPALLAPSRLAAVGHSLRTGLSRNDIVPRDPMHGRGPASSYRPAIGAGALLMPPASTDDEDCPADLIPGVLALYPKTGTGVEPVRGRRSRVQGARLSGFAPQMPVYSWHLPSRTCAGVAVTPKTGGEGIILSTSTFGRMMTAIPLLPTRASGAR